jgi:hypothetical protein
MKGSRGFILLTVLLLLMLAAVVMASVCRLAIRKSLEASAASEELQRRWGTISCRDAVLPRAEDLLELAETPAAPVTHLHAEFRLGVEQFTIDVSDEQAKANVNELFAIEGRDRTEQSILKLVRAAGGDLKPRLRLTAAGDLQIKSAPPTRITSQDGAGANDNSSDNLGGPSGNNANANNTNSDSTNSGNAEPLVPVFGSWSEVFPDVQLSDLLPGRPGAVTSNLTCWGNGTLNLHRASLASLTQMCSPLLSPQQIAQLVVVRGRFGDDATMDQILAAVNVDASTAATVEARLTLVSATQSLWICTRDHSGVQQSLIIRDASNSDDIRDFSFRW